MDRAERALYHQIHPAKLAADIAAELASTVLLWRHHLAGSVLVRFVPPVVASAFVMVGRRTWNGSGRQRPAATSVTT